MTMVYVFMQTSARHTGGVFSSKKNAAGWIARYSLTGILTAYPLDKSAYDWSIERGLYKPKNSPTAAFVGGFASARQPHWHFENGVEVSGDGDADDA